MLSLTHAWPARLQRARAARFFAIALLSSGRALAQHPEPAVEEYLRDSIGVTPGEFADVRRGKVVTTVSGLTLNEAGLQELAARLKERCGTGGTVKDGRIEIQGDLRDRVAQELERIGYGVKRVGG